MILRSINSNCFNTRKLYKTHYSLINLLKYLHIVLLCEECRSNCINYQIYSFDIIFILRPEIDEEKSKLYKIFLAIITSVVYKCIERSITILYRKNSISIILRIKFVYYTRNALIFSYCTNMYIFLKINSFAIYIINLINIFINHHRNFKSTP